MKTIERQIKKYSKNTVSMLPDVNKKATVLLKKTNDKVDSMMGDVFIDGLNVTKLRENGY